MSDLSPDWHTLRVEAADGPVCMLRLSRPEHRNAISRQLAEELVECLKVLSKISTLRVLILAGDGPVFSAGGDLRERLEGGARHSRDQRELLLKAIALVDTFPCPVIAMIQGAAIAGGLELALGCDIRVAADDAVFALPEVRAVGGFPGAGGPVRLTQLIGRGRAGMCVYTARKFSAQEALQFGIVEQVCGATTLLEVTSELAQTIAQNSPAAIRAAKVLMRRCMSMDLQDALNLSRELRNPLDHGPDFAEAMSAWAERRSPRFPDISWI
jgi:enoyl-CoA hydratase/carnithine racemase